MTDERPRARRGLLARFRAWRSTVKAEKLTRPLPTRDSAVDGEEAVEFRDLVIKSGFAIIPIIGVILFVIKLLIQTRGDANLALAIIGNMALATVAFVLLLTLLPYLVAGVVAGTARVHFNLHFSAGVRRVAGWMCWGAVIVLLFSQPWWFLALALSYIAIERATEGREPERVVSLEQWGLGPAPEDSELRRHWSELRAMMRDSGKSVPARRGDTDTAQNSALTRKELAEAVSQRFAAIAERRRKTPMSAIYTTIIAILAAFGVTLLTGPIRLAPTEHVTFQDGTEQTGYLFSSSPDQVLFVDRAMKDAQYVTFDDIESRFLCAPASSILNETIFGLLTPTDEEECPPPSESVVIDRL